jgi:uncharacterized protein
VHSYTEVYHVIQRGFQQYTPYLVLRVELDTLRGKPTEEEGLHVIGDLTRPDGVLAARSNGSASALAWAWTIDKGAAGGMPWRYQG